MSPDRAAAGRRGEEAARRYLRRNGYRILETNYRTRRGEVDLIAEKEGSLVFVEVRYRRSEEFGSPADSVGRRKRRRLILAAERFLQERGLHDRPSRFDLIALVSREEGVLDINHFENAFDRLGNPTGAWTSGGR